jgi:hypothetical protein
MNATAAALLAIIGLVLSQATYRNLKPMAGDLTVMPASCQSGDLYVAQDQPPGQQLYLCGQQGWYQTVSLGGSGALAIQDGTLDVVPSVIPFRSSPNTWSGLNSFTGALQVVPTATDPGCTSQSLGSIWMDSTDSKTTKLKFCLNRSGKPVWVLK